MKLHEISALCLYELQACQGLLRCCIPNPSVCLTSPRPVLSNSGHLVEGDIGERIEEAALEVWHHRRRIAAQAQDLQQRRIADKIEPATSRVVAKQQLWHSSMATKGSGKPCCNIPRMAMVWIG